MKSRFVLLFSLASFLIMVMLLSFKVPEPIEYKWDQSYKVRVTDFRIEDTLANNTLATLQSGIHFRCISQNGLWTYSAIALANRSTSVMTKKVCNGYRQKEVLDHEQIHFDITEYVTRLLNKQLQGIDDNSVALKLYYHYSRDTLDLIQTVYDAQTNHNNDPFWQAKWRMKMDQLLRDPHTRNDWRMYP